MQPVVARDHLTDEVRAGLARRSLTQEQLAIHLGLSRNAVNKRLTGQRSFSHVEVVQVAELLQVSVASLYGEASS